MRSIEEVSSDINEARESGADFESVIKPLLDERVDILKHDRDKWDDINYCVMIDCPEHLSHKIPLFTYGHRYAGVWECTIEGYGISESCPHYQTEYEITEDYEGAPDEIMICSLCRVAVEDE